MMDLLVALQDERRVKLTSAQRMLKANKKIHLRTISDQIIGSKAYSTKNVVTFTFLILLYRQDHSALKKSIKQISIHNKQNIIYNKNIYKNKFYKHKSQNIVLSKPFAYLFSPCQSSALSLPPPTSGPILYFTCPWCEAIITFPNLLEWSLLLIASSNHGFSNQLCFLNKITK